MSAAPPVKERPKCPGCSKPLTPRMAARRRYSANDLRPKDPRPPEWLGTYRAYGNFCTLRCCEFYANEMFRRTDLRFTLAPKVKP